MATEGGYAPIFPNAELYHHHRNSDSHDGGHFGEEVALYIWDSTPAVLLVGCRCMNRGYSLIWPKGESAYFLLPKWSGLPVGDER